MKLLLPLLVLCAVSFLGWKYKESESARKAAEARTAEVLQENEQMAMELQVLKSGKAVPRPPGAPNTAAPAVPAMAKANWVEERNRAWKSSLDEATGGKPPRPPKH